MPRTAVLVAWWLAATLIAASCATGDDGELADSSPRPDTNEPTTPPATEEPTSRADMEEATPMPEPEEPTAAPQTEAPAPSGAVTRIRLADNGGTVRLVAGETAFLRLPDDRSWTTPRADEEVVMVVPMQGFAPDGHQHWELRAFAAGTTKLHTEGTSFCPPDCPADTLVFSVDLIVSEDD